MDPKQRKKKKKIFNQIFKVDMSVLVSKTATIFYFSVV